MSQAHIKVQGALDNCKKYRLKNSPGYLQDISKREKNSGLLQERRVVWTRTRIILAPSRVPAMELCKKKKMIKTGKRE